ncbi:MAG TPA: alpha-amylase family glycosyl hydrolase [Chryseosolibacter sp.]|nr:alpha-amylase family glycosyl hydrolase [Chryseosolibacter sp.]
MKHLYCLFLALAVTSLASAQTVTTDPTFPSADQPVTITVDVSGTSLDHFAWNNDSNPVWIWTWIADGCSSNCDAPTNVNPATAAQDAAKVTRISTDPDIYQITFTPTTFFNKPASELKEIGFKFKSSDWADNKQTDNDRFITFSSDFQVALTQPSVFPVFKDSGEQLTISANASGSSTMKIFINGNEVASTAGVTSINYVHTITETIGTSTVEVRATSGSQTKSATFDYTVRTASVEETRPDGVVDGINYHTDNTTATLSVWAPGKTSAYLIGDFTDWKVNADYQMKKDGEHFWIHIDGLTPGVEYAFQYLINESLYIADPYSDKILDPDDQYIPDVIYPGLKTYPSEALSQKWYFNRLSVLQTNQSPYEWQTINYSKPETKDLVIYEMLVRDFVAADDRNYQTLIDTIGYFKRLGINAVQLMPVMEFGGNDSWGYNPTFMFAPDKAYGTKDKLKEFIDRCHAEGIAVILDITMNHHDTPNPYVMMDFDFTAFKPTAANKWFNVDAKHPFNVFFDMNHESTYTKTYLDTVNYYWLNEYKVDGFRYDLSKGFTQRNNPNNIDAWGAKDDSRIAILKRMADRIREYSPDAILILEHFADNAEEEILSDYGFLLWGNMNHAYNQNAMGFGSDSDISWGSYKARGWDDPNLITYIESHDEERMMFRNLQFGNSSGGYSVKSLDNALDRVKAAAAFFFTVPGPKMLWQFGELGYDVSIDFNGRVGAKPVRWEYLEDPAREKLFETFASLIHLRNSYDVFDTEDFFITGGSTLSKQITLRNQPYTTTPANADEMNVHVIGNFDVTAKNVALTFPHAGNWFDYFSSGDTLKLNSQAITLTLAPGEFRLYTDVKLANPGEELNSFVRPASPVLVSVTETDGDVVLTWEDHSEIENSYSIYRGLNGTFENVGEASKDATTFTDESSLVPETTYTYYVSANNNFGATVSNELDITTTIAVVSNEPSLNKRIRIAPNPVASTLTIHSAMQIRSVSLLSLEGKRTNLSLLEENKWSVSGIPTGFYIAEVVTNAGIAKLKVVKQ